MSATMPAIRVARNSTTSEGQRRMIMMPITRGTSNATFAPEATCTRGQIVTFLWRANGRPEADDPGNPFQDVPADRFYSDAVLWAVEKDVTEGVSATAFAPDDTCSRGQIVTFLYRTEKAKGRE